MGYARSVVMMITGSRGSGKSLFLSSMAVEELLRGKNVWSNMPVKLTQAIANRYGVSKLETKPLDLDAFYALSEELQNGVVCIDEAQNMSDSRTSLTLKNRLLNAIVAQVRKRNLNVYYTIQDPSWVDVRLRFATDVEVACFDLGYSPWGRGHNVEWGKLIRCYFKDLSGYMTGTPYFITGKYYRKSIFKGYKYWNCYDTSKVTDLEEAFTSVKLDLKQRVITNKEDNNDVSVYKEPEYVEVIRRIKEYKFQNGKELPAWQLNKILGELGHKLNSHLRSILNSSGIHWDAHTQGYLIDN